MSLAAPPKPWLPRGSSPLAGATVRAPAHSALPLRSAVCDCAAVAAAVPQGWGFLLCLELPRQRLSWPTQPAPLLVMAQEPSHTLYISPGSQHPHCDVPLNALVPGPVCFVSAASIRGVSCCAPQAGDPPGLASLVWRRFWPAPLLITTWELVHAVSDLLLSYTLLGYGWRFPCCTGLARLRATPSLSRFAAPDRAVCHGACALEGLHDVAGWASTDRLGGVTCPLERYRGGNAGR